MSPERWLPIPGFDGYEVSSEAPVTSLTRPIRMRNGRTRWHDGQILAQISNPRPVIYGSICIARLLYSHKDDSTTPHR